MATKDTKRDTGSVIPNPFGDITTMLEQFKVPGIDMTSFIDSRRKDVEALVEANKASYEAMQELARTETEMLTQAMQSIQESAKGLSSGQAGVPDATKQAEVVRAAWAKMLADMTSLAEMAHKAQADSLARLTARAQENMEEFQQMLRPK